MTVGQLRVLTGSPGITEVTQVEPLLDMIPTTAGRTLLTLDTVHTHATTAKACKNDRGIDFILTAKSDQPTLLTDPISRFRSVVTANRIT